jgi:excinuclease UvrABC nuclease subunit
VLTHRLEFVPEHDAEIFAAIPAASAVFLLRGDDPKSEPYVTKTANLRRRLQRLLGPPEERTKRLNLRDRIRSIEYSLTGSDFESGFLLYKLLRETFPKAYSQRLRLRFAPLVKLHMDNEYPRASITTRLGRLNGQSLYYGPFLSRVAAEKFANDALDFFKMRRCVDDLHPDPAFPGCVYSEMKMCLAPCFKGCTDDEYRAEVTRVQAFFDSNGNSLTRELEDQREQASTHLEFESAAAIHTKLEKLQALLTAFPEIIHRIHHLAGVMVQKSAVPESVSLFRIDAGCISDPVTLSIQRDEHAKSQSMESRIEHALASAPPMRPHSATEAMEHLAILKRWFYRGTRAGEIFFADDKGALPMRRIVRGVGRVYSGEKAENPQSAAEHPTTTQTES